MLASGLVPERRYVQHLLEGRDLISVTYREWLESYLAAESEAALCPTRGLAFNA